jgi:hypothetical protein
MTMVTLRSIIYRVILLFSKERDSFITWYFHIVGFSHPLSCAIARPFRKFHHGAEGLMCRVHLWAPRTDVELHQLETHPHLCPARTGGCPEQQILVRMLHESAT